MQDGSSFVDKVISSNKVKMIKIVLKLFWKESFKIWICDNFEREEMIVEIFFDWRKYEFWR